MPLRFSLSSRLPPLLFRTTSVLGMIWMWDVASVLTLDASVSRPSRGAVVPRLGLASELVRVGLVSVSSSEGLGLGLASVSTKKSSCTTLPNILLALLIFSDICNLKDKLLSNVTPKSLNETIIFVGNNHRRHSLSNTYDCYLYVYHKKPLCIY